MLNDGCLRVLGIFTRNSSHYEYAPAVIEKMIINFVMRVIIIVRLYKRCQAIDHVSDFCNRPIPNFILKLETRADTLTDVQ